MMRIALRPSPLPKDIGGTGPLGSEAAPAADGTQSVVQVFDVMQGLADAAAESFTPQVSNSAV